MTARGFVLCVSGPSGSGKTSLCDRLADEFEFAVRSISYTTRPQRPAEKSGDDYRFVSADEFEALKERGAFLETARVFDNWYGTPLEPVEQALKQGHVIVMDIDTVGASNVKNRLGGQCVTVFIHPPSKEELLRRLKQRKQNKPQEIERRLQEAEREIEEARHYQYSIVNGDFESAYQELLEVVQKERSS